MSAPNLISPTTLSGGAPVGGSGTTNTIPRWTGASTLGDSGLIDNGTAVYTTTRDFAVGTATPSATSTIYKANNSLGAWNAQDLSVNGLSNGDAVYQRWYATGVAGAVGRFGVTFQSSVASFVWNSLFNGGVQTAELMRLTGAGNVGIGTTSPGARLHSVAADGTYQFAVSGTTKGIRFLTTASVAQIDAVDQTLSASYQPLVLNGSGLSFGISGGTKWGINSSGQFFAASGNGGTAAAPTFCESTGVSGMYFPSASTVAIAANGAVAATFSKVAGAGVALGGTTGLVFDASGTQQGLKLPATPDNTNPNTIDCYADGGTANSGGVTWTPSLRFGGATTGITGSQVGRYTRIGNMVFAQGTIALSSKGSATGSATISGLPTSANVAATIYYSIAIGYNSKVTFTGQLHGLISVNSGIVELYQTSTAGVVSAITNTDFAADSVLTFTVCYPVT